MKGATGFVLVALMAASTGSGTPPAATPTALPADLLELSNLPSSAGRDEEVERRLRQAMGADDETRHVTNLLGWWLFSRERCEESLPFLERSCAARGQEKACAASSAMRVALGNWEAAERIATSYLARACTESDRLRAVTLLGTPDLAITAGEGLVRLAQDDEMSYLVLAAARHRAGDDEAASRALADGASRARRVRGLKLVRWSRAVGQGGTSDERGEKR